MQLTINDTPAVHLSTVDDRASPLEKKKAEITSVVFSANEATTHAMRSIAIAHACAVAFICLMLFGGWALAAPEEHAFFRYFAPGVAALTLLVFFALYRTRRKRWHAELPERVLASPPPGTPIRLDEAGLTIGNCFATWGEIAVDRVDVSAIGEIYGTSHYSVVRTLVRGPAFAFCLDRDLLLNGEAIVNNIYRRKHSATGLG